MWSPFFKPQQTRTEIRQPRIPCCICLPISCIFSPKKIIQGILSGLLTCGFVLWSMCVWWVMSDGQPPHFLHHLEVIPHFGFFSFHRWSALIFQGILTSLPFFETPLPFFWNTFLPSSQEKKNMCKGQCASNRHFFLLRYISVTSWSVNFFEWVASALISLRTLVLW